MGLAWSFFNPVFMLTVYTFVFSVIFKSRWGVGGDESKTQFAVVLFVGMIVHGLFAEVLNRAPSLDSFQCQLRQKSRISVGDTAGHCYGGSACSTALSAWACCWLLLLCLTVICTGRQFSSHSYCCRWSSSRLGLAWMLASLGVFLRDVGQTIGIITTVMMFLSPVFYPVTALPEEFRPWIMANPLTFIIEQAREVLIWGHLPDWVGLGIYTLAATVVAWAGYAWFQKTRKGLCRCPITTSPSK